MRSEGRGLRDRFQPLSGDGLPAERRVLSHVRDDRTPQLGGQVVPPHLLAQRVGGQIEAICGDVGEIQSTHERDLVVDDHDLLVVGVQRTLPRIEHTADTRAFDQLSLSPLHFAAPRSEQGHRRSRP